MIGGVLEIRRLTKKFGGLEVASDITLYIEEGERLALIGPNGAGKTTFVNMVSGVLTPTYGTIHLDGRNITRLAAPLRVKRGLVRTFQIARLFRSMTAREHLELAILEREGKTHRLFSSIAKTPDIEREAATLLAEMGLWDSADRPAGALAYGQQRLLEIALALALKPRFLILDEPAAGVARSESHRILEALDRLPPSLAVLMVEHDMDLVARFAQRVVVLSQGKLLRDGTPQEVMADRDVRELYLGTSIDAG